jgi:hypothetical protein
LDAVAGATQHRARYILDGTPFAAQHDDGVRVVIVGLKAQHIEALFAGGGLRKQSIQRGLPEEVGELLDVGRVWGARKSTETPSVVHRHLRVAQSVVEAPLRCQLYDVYAKACRVSVKQIVAARIGHHAMENTPSAVGAHSIGDCE